MTYSTSPQYQYLVVTMYIHQIFRIVSEASLEKSMTRLVAVFLLLYNILLYNDKSNGRPYYEEHYKYYYI